MKLLKQILLVLFAFLLLVAGSAYYYLHSLQPDYSSKLQLPGLHDQVEVLYDQYAIPHVYAQNEEDLFYAFGYVHAQDRLFQMEVLRRLADGRLSELFGEKALASDKFFRMLSFREHAKTTIAAVYQDSTAPFVKAAKAYLRGINQYIKKGKTPIEFSLAGIPKTEFTLEDMEIIVSYMGYTFVGAFRSESIATQIAATYGMDYFNDVLKQWPDSGHMIPVQASEKMAMQHAANTLTDITKDLAHIQNDLMYPPFLDRMVG